MALDLVTDFTIDEQIQALYLAYFNRAAEPAGLAHWRDRYETELAAGKGGAEILADFASAFANVPEAQAVFPFLADPAGDNAEAFVESVFQALFDRLPEGRADDSSTGFGFWVETFTREVQQNGPIGDSVLSILNGAQNADRTLVANKIAAADAFTDRVESDGLTYDQSDAERLLDGITADMSETEARLAADRVAAGAVTATVDIASDASFAGRTDEIEAAVREALDRVLSFLDPAAGNVEILIEAQDISSLATGGSTFFSADARSDGGVPSVFANQLTTGRDSNGPDSADTRISLSRDRIDAFDFGDGNGDFDAVNIFTHELFHGLGVSSFADTGESIMSVWGVFLEQRPNGDYVFTGPNAMAANGGEPVPLDGTAHLSETEFTNALMTPKAEFGGGEEITDLDVALLADLGLPVSDSFAIA